MYRDRISSVSMGSISLVPESEFTRHDASARVKELWQRRLDFEQKNHHLKGSHLVVAKSDHSWLSRAAEVFFKAIGLYWWGQANARRFQLREEIIEHPAIPADAGEIRLLHLSDFHYHEDDDAYVDALSTFLTGMEVDCCFMTGDYVYGYHTSPECIGNSLERLLDSVTIRHGSYAVLGNHDSSEMVPVLERHHIHPLVNKGCLLNIHGVYIWLGGVDNPHHFPVHSLDDALAGAPDDVFKLLLAHSPEIAEEAAKKDVDLYLCGHTHWGQIRFPVVGALYLNIACSRNLGMGRWKVGDMTGYTTAGVGTTSIPVRFGCPPEVVLFRLRGK